MKDVNNEKHHQAVKQAIKHVSNSAPFYTLAMNRKCWKTPGVANLVRRLDNGSDFEKVLKTLKDKGYTPGSLFSSGQGKPRTRCLHHANLYGGSVTDKEKQLNTTTDDLNSLRSLKKHLAGSKTVC